MQPQQNQYEFITNPPKQKWSPAGGLGLSSSSVGVRIAIFGLLITFLIVIGVVGKSLLASGSNVPNLIIVAEDQSEVARVASQPVTNNNTAVQQQATMNFAQTTNLGVESDQQQLLAFLSQHSAGTLSKEKLALKQNATVDQQLTTAAAASTYDATFLNIMQQELAAYNADLQKAYAHSGNPTEKQLLSSYFQHNQLLLQQLKAAQSTYQKANNQ